MQTEIVFRRRWQISFKSREAAYNQRFRISGSISSDGIYPGTAGTTVLVDGDSWKLSIEHNNGSGWKSSDIRLANPQQSGVTISYDVESEDIPQPDGGGDWNDLVLFAEYKGSVFEIVNRPFALRRDNLVMMPDGIFDTSIGKYYMGVQIKNVWVKELEKSTLIDLSDMCRQRLQNLGIVIDDTWSHQELQMLGQTQFGRGIVLGKLLPDQVHTVYFKADVSSANPGKPPVELHLYDRNPIPDPNDARRFEERKIFISRSYYDSDNLQMVCEIPEGRMIASINKIAVEEGHPRLHCRKLPPRKFPQREAQREQLRDLLKRLLEGEEVDPCRIKKLLDIVCCKPGDREKLPPGFIERDGKICWVDPFYYFIKEMDAKLEVPPYKGAFGPIPFEDPWWKLFLALLALIFGSIAAGDKINRIAEADEHQVAEVTRSLNKPFDVSVARLTGQRDYFTCNGRTGILDAQSGDKYSTPVETLNSLLMVESSIMTVTEIDQAMDDYIQNNDIEAVRVFKSGARTGMTYGLLNHLDPIALNVGGRQVQGHSVKVIAENSGDEILNKGDSGSVWIRKKDKKPAAILHSMTDNSTSYSTALEEVLLELNIDTTP